MHHLLVGFCGRAGSGKDTCASYLAERYGALNFRFAGPLKQMAKQIWAFTDEQIEGSQTSKETLDPRHNLTPRDAMQRLGEAGRNHLGNEVWIRACLDQIREDSQRHVQQPRLYTISDVRYRNEAEIVRDLARSFGDHGIWPVLVRLNCLDAPPAGNPNHPSEREVSEIPLETFSFEVFWQRVPRTNELIERLEKCLRGDIGVEMLLHKLDRTK